jgi:hypothetical protein
VPEQHGAVGSRLINDKWHVWREQTIRPSGVVATLRSPSKQDAIGTHAESSAGHSRAEEDGCSLESR